MKTGKVRDRGEDNIDEDEDVFPESHICMRFFFPLHCVFCWTCPLLWKGCWKPISEENLYVLPNHYKCDSYERRFKQTWKFFRLLSCFRIRLMATLYTIYFPEYFLSGLLKLISTILSTIYPLFLTQFLYCMQPLLTEEEQERIDDSAKLVPPDLRPSKSFLDENYRKNDYEIWIWMFALIFTQIITYIIMNYSYYLAGRVGVKMRVLLIHQVYKKIFSMTNKSREKRGKGEILNFLAYDAYMVDEGHVHVHDIWTSIVQVVFSFYFLVQIMGVEILFSIIILVVILTIMAMAMGCICLCRSLNLMIQDTRILHVKETFLYILQVKFFNRESIQMKKIRKYRRMELFFLRFVFLFRSIVNSVAYSGPPLMIITCFIIYYLVNEEFDSVVLLTSITYFTMLRIPLGSISINTARYMHCCAAMFRIQNFLEEEDRKELEEVEEEEKEVEEVKSVDDKVGIRIFGNFRFPAAGKVRSFSLTNLDVTIPKGSLVLVIGRTRSGKTTLVRTLLKETNPWSPKPKKGGKHSKTSFFKINYEDTKISYCGQLPWLENDTVLNNIMICEKKKKRKERSGMFRSPVKDLNSFEKLELSDVLKVCAMEEDVSEYFEGGLDLEVGDNSISLSGGQKSRIALCRAVYYNGDVFMLDNSLSSLDEFVGNHVFQYCILRYLKDKTRLLVTNKWEYLPYADTILVLKDGEIVESGTFETLYEKKGEMYDLIEGEWYEREEREEERKYDLEYLELLKRPSRVEEIRLEEHERITLEKQLMKEIEEDDAEEFLFLEKKYDRKQQQQQQQEEEEEEEEGEELELEDIVIEKESEGESGEELEEGGEGASESSSTSKEVTESSSSSSEEEKEDGGPQFEKGKLTVKEERQTGFISMKTFKSYISHALCPCCFFCMKMKPNCCCGCLVVVFVYIVYIIMVASLLSNEVHISYISKTERYMEKFGNDYLSPTCNVTSMNEYEYCDISEPYWEEYTKYVNTSLDGINYMDNVTAYIYVDYVEEPVEIFWDLNYHNETVVRDGMTTWEGFIVMGVIVAIFFSLVFCGSTFFFNTLLNTSNRIFYHVVDNLFTASMSFYYQNPVGRIINRVTTDISRTDYEVIVRYEFLTILSFFVLGAFGQVILSTLGIFLPIVLLILVLFFLIYAYIRKTAIELKRIESISRSFIFHSFHQSLEGLTTIKSFSGYDIELREVLEKNIDRQTRASIFIKAFIYSLRSYQSIAGVLVVFIVCVFSIMVSYYIDIEGAYTLLGLGIVNTVMIVDLIGIVFQQYIIFETELISAERLTFYIRQLKDEKASLGKKQRKRKFRRLRNQIQKVLKKKNDDDDDDDDENDNTDMPPIFTSPIKKLRKRPRIENGKIEFVDFSARYNEQFPYVLKGLNVTIEPGMKVLVIGMTGCGKSSVFNSLLGIFDLDNIKGKVLLDGKSLSSFYNYDIRDLRRQISIIPQDPVLFTGTIIENIDPGNIVSEGKLGEILQECGLAGTVDRVRGLTLKEKKMYDCGKNFSVGEKRLFCLARALVKESKIILLDECTGIDYSLDRKTQKIVTNLEDATVLSISHRLCNLEHYDYVMVMHQGEIAEFGGVSDLVLDEHSFLRELLAKVPNGKGIVRKLLKDEKDSSSEMNSEEV